MMDKRQLLEVIVFVIIATAAAIFVFFKPGFSNKGPSSVVSPPSSPLPSPVVDDSNLTKDIVNQVQDIGEKVPSTNPFNAQTNPFKNGYKNPFAK